MKLLRKRPKFIKSSRKREDGLIEQEWEVKEEGLPKWWNFECHCMKENTSIGGALTLSFFCEICNEYISSQGCKHNK